MKTADSIIHVYVYCRVCVCYLDTPIYVIWSGYLTTFEWDNFFICDESKHQILQNHNGIMTFSMYVLRMDIMTTILYDMCNFVSC